MTDTRVHGYARVSSKEQNETRQINALKEQGISERDIYIDKVSGKNFERDAYQRLLNVLRKGDLVIVMSIDRLGRDYSEVMEQWRYITQTLGANIKVLDMPLLDTSTNPNSLDSRFIADLVLQILSYVAQKERESIRTRQQQGINSMPIVNGKKVSSKTGQATGRPKMEKPEQWDEIYLKWVKKEITAVKAMEVLGLKNAKFYSLVKEEREKV